VQLALRRGFAFMFFLTFTPGGWSGLKNILLVKLK
jgi:hypothetical protein